MSNFKKILFTVFAACFFGGFLMVFQQLVGFEWAALFGLTMILTYQLIDKVEDRNK